MSEYQYYEFLALDRPLTAEQRDELRALSTRAEITAVSFVNEYHYGDFKGDPAQLMREYFDAHVYLANWGSRRLMLRLPREALEVEALEPYCVGDILIDDATDTHRLIGWEVNFEEPEYLAEVEAAACMARLAPLRDELLRGDLRSLYLGWLAAVSLGEVDDGVREPPVPAGLSQLTSAQRALAEFLEIDVDLLVGAVIASPPRVDAEPSQQELDGWIAALPREELERAFGLLLAGRAVEAESLARSLYRAWRRAAQPEAEALMQPRTVADLRKLADLAQRQREQQAAKQRAQAEAAKRKARDGYLQRLASDPAKAWADAHAHAERGSSQGYEEASRLLIDLAEAHARPGSQEVFSQALARFMERHGRRRTLVQRLTRAGLWR
jgi:hypothetical protein